MTKREIVTVKGPPFVVYGFDRKNLRSLDPSPELLKALAGDSQARFEAEFVNDRWHIYPEKRTDAEIAGETNDLHAGK